MHAAVDGEQLGVALGQDVAELTGLGDVLVADNDFLVGRNHLEQALGCFRCAFCFVCFFWSLVWFCVLSIHRLFCLFSFVFLSVSLTLIRFDYHTLVAIANHFFLLFCLSRLVLLFFLEIVLPVVATYLGDDVQPRLAHEVLCAIVVEPGEPSDIGTVPDLSGSNMAHDGLAVASQLLCLTYSLNHDIILLRRVEFVVAAVVHFLQHQAISWR